MGVRPFSHSCNDLSAILRRTICSYTSANVGKAPRSWTLKTVSGEDRRQSMSKRQIIAGTVRKLWPTEMDKFREHLLRLDRDSRRLRFAHVVTDAFIEEYASQAAENGSVVYALFEDDKIRAAAELKKTGDSWGQDGEAAFSVERHFQNAGHGTELMGRVIRSARNRGIQHLYVSCLAENTKMQAIARKYEAELKFEYGEVIGEIVPENANYFSFLAEAVEDRVGFMIAVLDLQQRIVKAA
jgi:RimJ/RimL family protein N-acetyltransferase